MAYYLPGKGEGEEIIIIIILKKEHEKEKIVSVFKTILSSSPENDEMQEITSVCWQTGSSRPLQ